MFSANQKPSDSGRKDSTVNAEREGEFCWSLGEWWPSTSCSRIVGAERTDERSLVATYNLREAVNRTAEQVPYGVDEFELAGLAKEQGNIVRAPMVKESPVKVSGRVLANALDSYHGCEWHER